MKRRAKLLLVLPVWRAWLEIWVLGAVALLLLLLNQARLEAIVIGQSLFFLMSAVTFWYALRLRLAPKRALWPTIWHELLVGFALFPVAAGGWWLLLRGLDLHTVLATHSPVPGGPLMIVALSFPIFLAARFVIYLWMLWLDLRRRHMVWALTHIQVQLVLTLAIIASVISSAVIVLGARRPLGELDTWVRTILPFASVAGVSTLIALVGILPPAVLIAWLTARRTTRRLKALTDASAALRDGETSTRILVDGEDEVAQLQADFNAMAAALDRTMTALQAERDKVAALLEARRQLIAGVSHELRTPLATLRGYLESMQQAPEAEALAHDLAVMEGELSRLQVLIDDLFTLSRAEVNGLALELQPVDLSAVVTRRVDAVAPLAWQRDRIRVIAELPSELPRAYADEIRVEQILVNLLRNALRHTPPGGIVAVSLTAMAEEVRLEEVRLDEVRLSVCDTGEGILREELPHIWERFYRGDRARARDAHGAGLGLSLVKELTEAMGGRVAVESEPRQGTCFHVWFPLDGQS